MSEMLLLVEPQIPALRRYARALIRDRDAADDLVQDCLERAIGRWHQWRQEGNPRAWLFGILHNLAMNRFAKRGPLCQVAIEDADESSLARPAPQPDRIQHRDLLRALDQLLDVPIGTVMSRLSRAREKLAQIMEGSAGDTPASQPVLRRIK